MRMILVILIICIIPAFGFSQSATVDTPTKTYPITSFRPAVSISEALAIAEHYVKEHNVDLSEQYIHYARLLYDDGAEYKKGLYWHIQWVWGTPRLGREYGLWICMDRKVIPKVTGP